MTTRPPDRPGSRRGRRRAVGMQDERSSTTVPLHPYATLISKGCTGPIAMALIRHPGRLTPNEIRFLRKWLGWSGVDFAKHMGVTPETVSRWESVDNGKPMGGTAERLLRLAVAHGQPIDEYPIDMLVDVSDDQVPKSPLLAMKPERSGWLRQAWQPNGRRSASARRWGRSTWLCSGSRRATGIIRDRRGVRRRPLWRKNLDVPLPRRSLPMAAACSRRPITAW